MNERFEVQARLVRRQGSRIVRDESRTVPAASLSEATTKADEFVAAGFTTWIYRLDAGAGINPVHRLVRRSAPAPTGASARSAPQVAS